MINKTPLEKLADLKPEDDYMIAWYDTIVKDENGKPEKQIVGEMMLIKREYLDGRTINYPMSALQANGLSWDLNDIHLDWLLGSDYFEFFWDFKNQYTEFKDMANYLEFLKYMSKFRENNIEKLTTT